MQIIEIPGKYILGVTILDTTAHKIRMLCKRCYCKEYEMDETSVSTATAQPQPDMQVEKHLARLQSVDCDTCGKHIEGRHISHDLDETIKKYFILASKEWKKY